MGPYCKYCDQRCFVPLPNGTPAHIRAAYGGDGSMIVATCPGGKRFERSKVGYCLDDIYATVNGKPDGTMDEVSRTPEERHGIALGDFCYHLETIRGRAAKAIAAARDAIDRLEDLVEKTPASKASGEMTAEEAAELLKLAEAGLAAFKVRTLRDDVVSDLHRSVTEADYAIGALDEAQLLRAYLSAGDFTT